MTKNRIEVITSVERRRRWSTAEKARLLAAIVEPGAVASEIARDAGVDVSLLYRWRRQLAGREERAGIRARAGDARGREHSADDHADLRPACAVGSGFDHDCDRGAGSRDGERALPTQRR